MSVNFVNLKEQSWQGLQPLQIMTFTRVQHVMSFDESAQVWDD